MVNGHYQLSTHVVELVHKNLFEHVMAFDLKLALTNHIVRWFAHYNIH